MSPSAALLPLPGHRYGRRVERANRLFAQAVEALRVAAGPTASDADLLAVLTFGEDARRALDQASVAALAGLERRGTFAERGYRSSAAALADLLGWERADAKRYLSAAEHVRARAGLDGAPLPPRLPATAAAFEAGLASVRHVGGRAEFVPPPWIEPLGRPRRRPPPIALPA
jgi:Domain of unknown function (DUF222)